MPSFSLRPALGPLLLIGALSSVAACGGIVVFDDVEGTGGAGGEACGCPGARGPVTGACRGPGRPG